MPSRDPKKRREQARRRLQALSPEDRRAMYRRKRGMPAPTRPEPEGCEICGKDSLLMARGLHLDHDHRTGKFRGWLCKDCNTALGQLGDTAAGVRRALVYLERSHD